MASLIRNGFKISGGISFLEKFQVSEMPEASSVYTGKIYQYTGETSPAFTNGLFYKCTLGDNSAYTWEPVYTQPVDGRIALTKDEMVRANDNILPDIFGAFCRDDGLFYVYNKSNPEIFDTGKFRKFEMENGLQYKVMPEAVEENKNEIIQYIGETDSTYTKNSWYFSKPYELIAYKNNDDIVYLKEEPTLESVVYNSDEEDTLLTIESIGTDSITLSDTKTYTLSTADNIGLYAWKEILFADYLTIDDYEDLSKLNVKSYNSSGEAETDVKMVHLTRAEYEALSDAGTLDSKTYYHITDDTGTVSTNLFTLFQGLYSASPAQWDLVPTQSSTNPVTSGGVYTAIKAARDAAVKVLTTLPAEGEENTIYYVYDSVSGEYATYIWDVSESVFKNVGTAKLTITMDAVPTLNSENPVTSGGIYSTTYNSVKAYDKNGIGITNCKLMYMTKAEYDGLATYDSDTIYIVKD